MVNYGDAAKRRTMFEALSYLVKTDQFVRVRTKDMKTFFKGLPPKDGAPPYRRPAEKKKEVNGQSTELNRLLKYPAKLSAAGVGGALNL
jgi:hypothetical protein